MEAENLKVYDTNIAQEIIDLKNADLAVRDELLKSGQLNDGYSEAMRELHNSNAKTLNVIIDNIGYPTIDKVGKEANEAAWLVIQHAIENPAFMMKCAQLLAIAISENKADPKHLAYLTDRIAVFKGEPQLYGTQFDWDENGNLAPNLFDNLTKVNIRRQLIGLKSLEEQINIMQTRVKEEKQSPPVDFKKRQQEMLAWKVKVGWII